MHDDRRQPIAIFHMNDSDDLTIRVSDENFDLYCGIAIVHEESIFVSRDYPYPRINVPKTFNKVMNRPVLYWPHE